MTTSGTFSFNPSLSDIVLNAYGRIGLRPTALVAEHLKDAADEANYLLVEISNKQPLLWTSSTQSIPLVQGTATYNLAVQTVMILIGYIRTGTTTLIDRVVTPLSTVEYASQPNKAMQAPPTTFWFDRQIAPQITLWPTPDGNGPYTLLLQTVRQVQDASLPSGTQIEVPYRFLDAFAAGLAARLARIHAPQLETQRKQDALEAWTIAATQDTENVPLYIVPSLSNYYR